MKDIKNVFRRLEKMLTQARWFQDDWAIYNRGEYMQLYKNTWFNQSQGGVHFETYIESRELRQGEFPICVHAEEDCPARDQVIAGLLRLEGDRIRAWKGYRVVGSGFTICERRMPLNFKNLEQRLLEEFNRLRQLEASIDEVLRGVERS